MQPETQTTTAACAPWKVLLVDDEPAVHEVSQLILRGLRFEGAAVDLLSAASAAQARDLLGRHPDIALVLLDVVMETDDAGMHLVEFVRRKLGNHDMQIIVRTGQPGMAPEREVIVDYEINGYLLKTEITAQRLHSTVIAALRGYSRARSLGGHGGRGDAEGRARDLELAGELDDAAPEGRIVLQAQAQLRLDSLSMYGVELIAKWKTRRGLLSTEQVADRLGMGAPRVRTMRWLLGQGVSWARHWQAQFGSGLRVSLPLIGEFLDDPPYLQQLLQALGELSAPSLQIDLWLSQAVVQRAESSLLEAMQRLRQTGVGFVFRDFGAATIALPYLSSLGFESLRLPRCFVDGVAEEPQRAAMARSLIALAQTLGALTIADGVGSDADLQFLRWEGCEVGQGPAMARASAPSELVHDLNEGSRTAH